MWRELNIGFEDSSINTYYNREHHVAVDIGRTYTQRVWEIKNVAKSCEWNGRKLETEHDKGMQVY